MILLFFDPDKPGTTGETLNILTSSLVGLDHKLHIILNKVRGVCMACMYENELFSVVVYVFVCFTVSLLNPRRTSLLRSTTSLGPTDRSVGISVRLGSKISFSATYVVCTVIASTSKAYIILFAGDPKEGPASHTHHVFTSVVLALVRYPDLVRWSLLQRRGRYQRG